VIHLPVKLKIVAACLSFIAGYVDALGFVHFGGYFVSFMSGNTTRMGVSGAMHPSLMILPASLLLLFILGVVIGTLLAKVRPNRGHVQLDAIAAILAFSALLAMLHLNTTAALLTPVAMGAMNTIFQRNGEVSVGVTYMTGTLVKLGQRLAVALIGGDRWAWRPYFLLWLGLALGAVCGALIYPRIGLAGLGLPAAALFTLGRSPVFSMRPTALVDP